MTVLRLCLLLLLPSCAPQPPVPPLPSSTEAKLEPAPTPHGGPLRRSGTVGRLEVPIPPKMPLGTGAVPVSSGVARGSIVTGFREAF